jgi:hypothetical protein
MRSVTTIFLLALSGCLDFVAARGRPCQLVTCATLAPACGQLPDGCGHVLTCGCDAPETCSQSGICTCESESDAVFCNRLAKVCGAVTDTDNCGRPRSVVSCGGCNVGTACGVDGACHCAPESDASLCARNDMCGTHTGVVDNCGLTRPALVCTSACATGRKCLPHGFCGTVTSTDTYGPPTVLGAPVSDETCGVQDVIAGLSPDELTLLVGRVFHGSSTPFKLLVFERATLSASFPAGQDVAGLAQINPTNYPWKPWALTDDRLTVVVTDAPSYQAFYRINRASASVAFASGRTNDWFSAINAARATNFGAASVFDSPSFSGDGLAFYYTVNGATDTAKNGVYRAARATVSDPFPDGAQQVDPLFTGTAIVTLTPDELTFVVTHGDFTLWIGFRDPLTGTFSGVTQLTGPGFPGYRAQFNADGSKIYATGSATGGCSGGNAEDFAVYVRQ